MRSAFGHEGQAASLEEWSDPARLNAGFEPKGFHLGLDAIVNDSGIQHSEA